MLVHACVSCEGGVASRSLLSDQTSRLMLWCEGHCQETTTRQHRYSCPQCSFFPLCGTNKHTHPSTTDTQWWEKPPWQQTPGRYSVFQNKHYHLHVDCWWLAMLGLCNWDGSFDIFFGISRNSQQLKHYMHNTTNCRWMELKFKDIYF